MPPGQTADERETLQSIAGLAGLGLIVTEKMKESWRETPQRHFCHWRRMLQPRLGPVPRISLFARREPEG